MTIYLSVYADRPGMYPTKQIDIQLLEHLRTHQAVDI